MHFATSDPRLAPYVVLVFALAVPFWLAGTCDCQLLGRFIPIDLPVSALAAFVPMTTALILSFQDGGPKNAAKLLGTGLDVWKIKDLRWLLAALLVMPAVLVTEYGWMAAFGQSMPDAQFPIKILPVYLVMFSAAAAGEELGWQAYGVASIRGRYSALQVSLIIGLIWSVWHIVPYLQTHRTHWWVIWQCMHTILARVLMVWLSNNAGESVFIAVVFHMMINVSEFIFPNYGSYYDSFIASIVMAVLVALVVVLWGPKTLSEFRFARR
jgi:membrane protease YdiL (CAAX protease family)